MSDKRIGSSRFTSSFCDSASVRELYLRWSNCDCENKNLKNILWILESTEVERTFSKRGTSDGTAIYMVVSIIKSWILYFKPTPSTENRERKGKTANETYATRNPCQENGTSATFRICRSYWKTYGSIKIYNISSGRVKACVGSLKDRSRERSWWHRYVKYCDWPSVNESCGSLAVYSWGLQ